MEAPAAAASAVDCEGLVALAQGLARIPSQIPHEGTIAEFLAAEMRKLGCYDEVILQPVVEGRPNVIGIIRGSSNGQPSSSTATWTPERPAATGLGTRTTRR